MTHDEINKLKKQWQNDLDNFKVYERPIEKNQNNYMQEENRYLRMEIDKLRLSIRQLKQELIEANKELELLRPFGIVWRGPKKNETATVK